MCYSARVSLFTFGIGTFFSWLLARIGTIEYKIIGGFLGFVALMQGLEYILWRNQSCGAVNKTVSYIAMWANHLQPVVLIGLFLWIGRLDRNRQRNLWMLLAAYVAVIVPYSLQFTDTADMRCTLKGDASNPHLLWNWNGLPSFMFIYAFFVLVVVAACVIGFLDWKVAAFYSTLFTGTFIVSRIFYRRAVGAMWCFFAAFVPAALWGIEVSGLRKQLGF